MLYSRALFLGERPARFQPEIAHIQFIPGDAASYLESRESGSLDAFTLSNILDGAAASYRERVPQAVRHAAAKDAAVILRSFGEPPAGLVNNHAERDRTMLWGVGDIRSASSFRGVSINLFSVIRGGLRILSLTVVFAPAFLHMRLVDRAST